MEALRLWRMEADVNPYREPHREPHVYDMAREPFPWRDVLSWGAMVAVLCVMFYYANKAEDAKEAERQAIRAKAAHCHRFGGVLVREAGTSDLVCSPVFPVPAEK
jgi:hypothetical protein